MASAWVVGKDLVLVIDDRAPSLDASLAAAVARTTDRPVRFLLGSRTGLWTETGTRLSAGSRLAIGAGDQQVEVSEFGGRFVAHLPAAKLVFAGALLDPQIAADQDTEELVAALDALLALDPKIVVPARGKPGGRELIASRRDALTELRHRVGESLSESLSRDQIVDAADEGERTNVAHVHDELAGRVPPPWLREDLGLIAEKEKPRAAAGWSPPRKVLVALEEPAQLARLARAVPELELVPVTQATAGAFAADADAVIGLCTPEILAHGTKLRWIQVGSAGVERYLSMPGLTQSPVTLTNAQRLYGPEIAEHAIAMLLAITRGLRVTIPAQQDGSWLRGNLEERVHFIELGGKTALVLGLGGIGSEIARRVNAFGMTVLATRRKTSERPSYVQEIGPPAQARELAARADVVFNCLPLTRETERTCDAAFFAAMKDGAYYVNVGRGKTTDTDALVKALASGKLGGAALDVTDPEPLPKDHALWRLPNVVISPHISAHSDRQGERLFALYRENLRRFALGEPLLSVVDKAAGY
jgi:phosphoglycerate dehydrogenase-like enzyme